MSGINETPGPLGYLAKFSVRNLGITFDSGFTQNVSLCDQLFVCFANPARGPALPKQWLSHWIIEAISLVYSTKSLALPQGVRVHSTMGMETSWALFERAMIFVLQLVGHYFLFSSIIWMSQPLWWLMMSFLLGLPHAKALAV